MKRPSYKKAIQWIAENDNDGLNDNHEDIQWYLTVAFVADLFDITTEKVAKDVFKRRGGDPDAMIAGSHT